MRIPVPRRPLVLVTAVALLLAALAVTAVAVPVNPAAPRGIPDGRFTVGRGTRRDPPGTLSGATPPRWSQATYTPVVRPGNASNSTIGVGAGEASKSEPG